MKEWLCTSMMSCDRFDEADEGWFEIPTADGPAHHPALGRKSEV